MELELQEKTSLFKQLIWKICVIFLLPTGTNYFGEKLPLQFDSYHYLIFMSLCSKGLEES